MEMEKKHPEQPILITPTVKGKRWGNDGGFIADTVVWISYPYPTGFLHIGKNAGIFDKVKINLECPGNVEDNAVVYGNAQLGDGSRDHLTEVYGNARVYGDAKIAEWAKVYGNAIIYGDAHIYGHAKVFGDAKVSGAAKIHGNVEISGNAWIHGYTKICGELKISGDVKVDSGIYFSEKEAEVKSMEEWEHLSRGFKCKNEEELNERQKINITVMEVSSRDRSKIHVVLKQGEFRRVGDTVKKTKKDEHGKYWKGIVKKVEEKTYAEWDNLVGERLYSKDIELVSEVDPLAEIEDLCIFFFSSLCASSAIVGQMGRFFS